MIKTDFNFRRRWLAAWADQSGFRRSWCFLCAVFVAVCALSSVAFAGVDIIVGIDNSGSMRHNDPAGLMPVGLRGLANRLENGSRLAVLLFDTKSRLVMPLTAVDDSAFSTRVEAAIQAVDYRGRLTDTPGAIEEALYELRERGRQGSPRVILLITDGFVDVGTAEGSRDRARWLTTDLVKEAQRQHVAIFGLAFTNNADFALIQSISQGTGGLYFRATTAEDLAGVFQRIDQTLKQLSARPDPLPLASVPKALVPSRRIPLFWLVAAPLVALVSVAALWWLMSYRASPSIAATLQDVGQHSLQAAYPLNKRVIRVGGVRRPSWTIRNDIVLPYPTISRQHAEIWFTAEGFVLYALPDTTNHSYVNGRRLVKGSQLAVTNGDALRFDAYEFRFLGGRVPADGTRGKKNNRKTQVAEALDLDEPGGRVPDRVRADLGPRDDAAVPSPEHSAKKKPQGQGPTLRKPAASSGGCPVCGQPVPSDQLEMWGDHRICPECRVHILSTASPEEVQHILLRLDTEESQRTLIRPKDDSGV